AVRLVGVPHDPVAPHGRIVRERARARQQVLDHGGGGTRGSRYGTGGEVEQRDDQHGGLLEKDGGHRTSSSGRPRAARWAPMGEREAGCAPAPGGRTTPARQLSYIRESAEERARN